MNSTLLILTVGWAFDLLIFYEKSTVLIAVNITYNACFVGIS